MQLVLNVICDLWYEVQRTAGLKMYNIDNTKWEGW